MNASAVAGLSRMSMPRNRTPEDLNAVASAERPGASARHGVHQEPQKFSTTTWPRYEASASRPPPTTGPLTDGATGPVPLLNSVVPGLPATKLCPLLAGVLAAMPVAQPATPSAELSARAPATAAPRPARAGRVGGDTGADSPTGSSTRPHCA